MHVVTSLSSIVETDGNLDMVVNGISTSLSSDQLGVGTFWTSDRWRSALSTERHLGPSLELGLTNHHRNRSIQLKLEEQVNAMTEIVVSFTRFMVIIGL